MKEAGTCWKCQCKIWLPDELYEAAQRTKHDLKPIPFHCAYGHSAVFSVRESEETKLRRECDRLTQKLAEKDDAIRAQRELREAAERSAAAARGQVTKLKRRAAGGVCPCCSRTFLSLQRHIATKHPEFQAGRE